MDEIQRRFSEIHWHYPESDPAARAELTARIAKRARESRSVCYSELVEGVTFRLPNVYGGAPFQLGAEWTELERAILGEFLGYISMESYDAGRIFASAVAVSKTTKEPSEGFWDLMKKLGIRPRRADRVVFWQDEFKKACAWYAAH